MLPARILSRGQDCEKDFKLIGILVAFPLFTTVPVDFACKNESHLLSLKRNI